MILAAPVIDIPASPRRSHAVPLVLSALVHLAIGLAWLGFPRPEPAVGEQAITVEIVPPAKPIASTDEKGEGQRKPEPEGRAIPQLEEGEVAARSSATAPSKPALAPPAPKVVAAPPEKKPLPVTQNERDFILSQVLRHWQPPRELVAYDKADIFVGVTVGPDGYFADAYDGRRKWNPEEVFDGYGRLHPQDIQRRTIDAFYRAIRQAQPLRLPEALRAKAPFTVRLDFRLRDARR